MVGQIIASYRIVSKLGEGGMGAVYLGEHQRIARKAAIKVLLQDFTRNQDVVDRFFREALATSRIRHPGIVEVLDCNVLPNGSAYIVMELLEGESLGAHLRRHGRLPAERAISFTRYIAEALTAAHDENIVHRDLKPDNVFVLAARPSGPSQPIKVVDFGIAKLLNTAAGQSNVKTRTGSIIGTPVYMSPEQCRGTGEIDHRTDIYSLGCMLFEMLTGRPPFTHEGFGELIQSHLGVVPPTLRSIDPMLPAPIEGLVARMLAKAPGDRPLTMRALVAELDAVLAEEPVTGATALTITPPAPRPGPVEIPRIQTTLGSASAEKMDVLADEALAVTKPRRRGAMIVGGIGVAAVAAIVAVAALKGASSATGTAPAAVPVASAPIAPAAVVAPKPVEAIAPPVVPAPPPAASVAAHAEPRPPRPETSARDAGHSAKPVATSNGKVAKILLAPGRVHLTITTAPTGADVCLAGNRTLLGKTTFDWAVERSSNNYKLLIRKTGYRGQELSVSAEGDGTHRIVLDKLGPDDIDDIVNCRQ